jgi:hypothetical protein
VNITKILRLNQNIYKRFNKNYGEKTFTAIRLAKTFSSPQSRRAAKKMKNLSLRTERSGVKQSHQNNPIPRRKKY